MEKEYTFEEINEKVKQNDGAEVTRMLIHNQKIQGVNVILRTNEELNQEIYGTDLQDNRFDSEETERSS